MFTESSGKDIKITVIRSCVPRVRIETEALNKMALFVKECSDEIGWLATATRKNNVITIHDAYLFDQEVHSTTTEITPQGLSEFGEALLAQEDGIEIWNNLKVWGHSHVNMSITPSGQDDKQMEIFSTSGHEWFVRLIANKKGDMKVDVYDYFTGVTYLGVEWEEAYTDELEVVMDKIDELYALIDQEKKRQLELIKAPIKAEMKEKVRKKTYYTYPKGTSTKGNVTTLGAYQGQSASYGQKTWEKQAEDEWEGYDVLGADHDILHYMDETDLIHIADNSRSVQDTADLVDEMGYTYFTNADMVRIHHYSQKLYDAYKFEDNGGTQ